MGVGSTMAGVFTTLSRSVSFRPLLLFLEALVLRKTAQTPMLTAKHSEYLLLGEVWHSIMDFLL